MSETVEPGGMSARELLDYWYEHVWHEDIDYRAIEGAIDDHGPIRGRDALRGYMQDWVETIDGLELSPDETIDAGDGTFVTVLRLTGKIRGGDTPVVSRISIVLTVRDGKVVRGREYGAVRRRCALPDCQVSNGRSAWSLTSVSASSSAGSESRTMPLPA